MAPMPPDRALVARDPALPGLSLVLDAESLAVALAARLPEAGLGRLIPSYLRYKPGTSCLAGFRADTPAGRLDLAAKALTPNAYAIERARPVKPQLRSPIGPVVLGLDRDAVIVRFVPYDRQLKGLPLLADPEARDALLRKLAPKLAGSGWTTLRHKPGRRHLVRLDKDGAPRAILRLYAKADFAQALLGARFAGRHGGPALLGFSERRRILITAWQEGVSLAELPSGGEDFLAGLAAAGMAIARAHRLRPRELLVRTPHAEAMAMGKAAQALAWLAPDQLGTARRLATAIAALLLATPERVGPLHGDFSADQVIAWPDGAVVLIDWDRAAVGPAAIDLGSFIARIEAEAILAGGMPGMAASGAFLRGYADEAGRRPWGLHGWIAAGLLRLAAEPFRRRLPDWPSAVQALLERAEWHLVQARCRDGMLLERSA